MAVDFNPFQFFKEEIDNPSPAIRINAVSQVKLIASALGPARTVSELVPHLKTCIREQPHNQDEEFLYQVAAQLAVLSDYVNNQEELLIEPLEYLAAQEETVIREQAITSLCTIVKKRPNLVQKHLLPTLQRLAVTTDFFTARVSACALFPTVYNYTEDAEEKSNLRKLFVGICSDDTPMVRRAAASKMKDLIEVVAKDDFVLDLIQIYKQLSQDDTQDAIRVSVVNATLVVAKMLNQEENLEHTVKVIQEATDDRSWRVRLNVAKSFPKLCENFGSSIMVSHLLECIVKLMKDHEQEVRKEAVLAIEACMIIPEPITSELMQQHILPQFSSHTALDPAQPVRAALAKVLGPVAKIVGRDVTQRNLLSMISDLMKDEFHDVRLNIVSRAGLICEVLGVDGLIHSLLHTIQSLIMDNHWRIRQSVVQQVPKLAKFFGQEMFSSKLESLFISSLRDSVHSVRKEAIKNLKEIAQTFGAQWTVEHLMPKITDAYSQSAGYANRVTTLEVLPNIAVVMNADQVGSMIVPILQKATKDGVPNVRFCACRKIKEIMDNHQLQPKVLEQIKASLTELQNDSDIDVQYYAQMALKKFEA